MPNGWPGAQMDPAVHLCVPYVNALGAGATIFRRPILKRDQDIDLARPDVISGTMLC
jgi:hypothetical protein